ncbi:MAG: flagellin FliC [Planctomycetes bacterium]|nr:flagellin FliC [Planctomycetota bacterium]
MGLRVGTNVQSLTAQRNLLRATNALNGNFARLSTGRRIASAADDAAGLAISARLNAQVRSLDAAVRNANDGVSLVQTAEGGLAEIESSLVRMRELAVQASNGTLSTADRNNLDAEFTQLASSIDQIAASTTFNGIRLLDSTASLRLQVGADTRAGVDTLDVSTVDVTASALTLSSASITSVSNASSAIASLDVALDTVTSVRGDFGAVQNRLQTTVSSLMFRSENLAAANSRIVDVDVARETAALTKNNILQQSALSILAQANSQPAIALSLL